MLKTILVPTDGSECAEKAIELAADLAKTYGAKLIVLHAWQAGPVPDALRHMAEVEHIGGRRQPVSAQVPLSNAPVAAPVVEPAIDWRLMEAVGENLLHMAKCTAQEFGAESIETQLIEGEPIAEILRSIEANKVDLIVMGTRGLSDIKGLLLGSKSHKLIQLAPCPTLTVK